MGLALLALAAIAYGSHVAHGGFYWDDWENAASSRFTPSEGFALGGLELSLFYYRPVHAVGLWLPHELFGANPSLHLALGVCLAVLASAALYAFLRTLGLERTPAVAICALVLIFPWSDSARLWATASINNLAIALYLLGTVVAVRGLEREGADARRWKAGALALYVLSVLTYEVTAAAALLSFLLYATRVPWREALRRWRLDAIAVAGALFIVGLSTTRVLLPPAAQLEHALRIADESLTLLAAAAAPFGSPPRAPVLAAMLALVAAGAFAAGSERVGEETRRALRRWLAVAGGSVVAVVAGYAAFVPGEAEYVPLSPGTGNRVNVFAAIGYAGIIVSLLMLAGSLAVAVLGRRRALAPALAAGATVVIGLGYLARLDDDKAAWQRSTAMQAEVLDAVRASVSEPPAGTTIYTFGEELYAAPGVPVFAVIHDLKGAVRLTLADGTVTAFPTHPEGRFECGASSLRPVDPAGDRTMPSAYGRAVFVDVRTGRAATIASPPQCRRESARFATSPAPAAAADAQAPAATGSSHRLGKRAGNGPG